MKRFHRALFWTFIALSVVFIGLPILGFLLLQFYDVNRLKPRIERIVSAQSGRAFAIHGDLTFTPSWAPTVRAEKLTLSNPEWAKEPEFASVGALDVSFQLSPLINGELVIDAIHVQDAEVHMEQGSQKDQQSWVFVPANQAAEEEVQEIEKESGFKVKPRFSAITVENSMLYYRPAGKETMVLGLPKASLDLASGAALQAEYVYQGVTGSLTLSGDGLPEFFEKGGPITFTARTPQKSGVVNFDGHVTDPSGAFVVKGTIDAKADSLAAFRPLSKTLPETEPVSLQAKGSASAERIEFSSFQLGLLPEGKVSGKGDIRLKGKPTITAELSLPPVIMESTESPQSDGAILAENQPATPLIPDAPLPVAWMREVNGTLQVTMPRFQKDKIVLQDIQATAVLKDGRLNVAPLRFTAFDGVTQGELQVDAAATPPRFAMKAEGHNWMLDQLIRKPDGQGGRFQGGRTHLFLDVNGSGDSLKPVIRTMNGLTGFYVSDLRYRSPAAAAALTDFFQLLRGKAGGEIGVKCGLGRFNLVNGVATSQALGFNTTGALVTGEGSIDLGDERINLVLSPRAKTVGLSDLAVPVRFAGKLQDPTIRLDARGTAYKVGEVALGIATGGTSLGWALLGKNLTDKLGVTADNDPCAEGAAAAGSAPVAP